MELSTNESAHIDEVVRPSFMGEFCTKIFLGKEKKFLLESCPHFGGVLRKGFQRIHS